MNHERMQEDLFAFYDGQLGPERRPVIAAHLERCLECQALLQRWRDVATAALRPLERPGSEWFVQSVMRRVRVFGEEGFVVQWISFTRWAYPALAVAMTAFVAVAGYAWLPSAPSVDSLLVSDGHVSTQWMSNSPTEDQILDAAVTRP